MLTSGIGAGPQVTEFEKSFADFACDARTNYRMSELQTTIGNVQLPKLPSFSAKRRQNALATNKNLAKNSKLVLPYESKRQVTQLVSLYCKTKDGAEDERNHNVD